MQRLLPAAILAAALIFPLTGYASRAQRAAALNAREDAQCRSYGAAPGSAAYVNCRAQLQRDRTARDAIAWQYLESIK